MLPLGERLLTGVNLNRDATLMYENAWDILLATDLALFSYKIETKQRNIKLQAIKYHKIKFINANILF